MLPVRFTNDYPKGKEWEIVFPSATNEIILDDLAISKLDWSSFTKFRNLEKIKFDKIRTESLDLKGIEKCEKLRELIITNSKFTHLNIDPLAEVSRLERLRIGGNIIAPLDLSPLSAISTLNTLEISENDFTQLDLSPLAEVTQLENLKITGNRITHLDLSPLAKTSNLRTLEIGENNIIQLDFPQFSQPCNLVSIRISENARNLNLEPLSDCLLDSLTLEIQQPWNLDLKPLMNQSRSHFKLKISQNSSSNISTPNVPITDLTPLVDFPMENISFEFVNGIVAYFIPSANIAKNKQLRARFRDHSMEHFIKMWGWPRMRDVLATHLSNLEQRANENRLMFQEEVLRSFRLGWLSGIDGNLLDKIVKAKDSFTFNQLRQILITESDTLLTEQLKRGGPTHFFDIDEMLRTPELIHHIPQLIHQRNKEMKEVTIYYDGKDHFDLEDIWLTHYGFQVLQQLRLDSRPFYFKVTTLDYEPIQILLDVFDVPIVTTQVPFKKGLFSEEMKEYLNIKARMALDERPTS